MITNLLIIIVNCAFLIIPQINAVQVIQDLGNENWTSCEQFLANITTFDAQKVVDIDWKIFYFWNEEPEKSYNIRFSLANPILVDRFKVELKHMDAAVNWSRALLFMETSIDFSALYLTTETPGKFVLIPTFAFQLDKIPLMVFGLKVVEPGYLGIVNCQHRLCYALAPVDKLPEEKEIVKAVENIGFKGDQNRSYLYHDDELGPRQESDEDIQLEVDKEPLEFDD